MPAPAYQPERRKLAEALKFLRAEAGLSGESLSQQLGWTQSKVSKIETLKQFPTEQDVTAWAEAAAASQKTVAELLGTLRRARVEHAAFRDAFPGTGASTVQADILALEAATTRIAEFQPSMIPGLLQTADFAREFLALPCGPASFGASEDEIDRMIAMRMQRQQALYERSKQVQIVLLEGALRCRVVSAETLAGQLDRLLAIAGLSALELGIIPFEAPVPIFPLSGFRLYDDLVIVESIVSEQQLRDPDDVARYEHYLELLRESASTGRDAAKIIQRAIDDLRQ